MKVRDALELLKSLDPELEVHELDIKINSDLLPDLAQVMSTWPGAEATVRAIRDDETLSYRLSLVYWRL